MPNDTKKAIIYALFAVLLWSTVATAFKLTLQYTNPPTLLFIASITSWLLFGTVLYIKRDYSKVIKSIKEYPVYTTLLGLINPFAYYLTLFYAYRLLPAQEAQAINYSWGLLIAFLSVPILGHKLKPKDILAGIICYFGIVVIATRGDILSLHFYNTDGVVYALLSTLLWALYWLYSSKLKIDSVVLLFINFTTGLTALGIYILFFAKDAFTLSLEALLGSVYIGVFEMGFTFLLWMEAMRLTHKASVISNLIYLSPLLSLFFIHYILGEEILPSTIVAILLIFTGLAVEKLNN